MRTRHLLLLLLTLAGRRVLAEGAPATDTPGAPKTLSGMSVLGNNEAPKSLVIVPWKSSQIGDGIGVVDSLSNRPLPVDRDVFGRELRYYEIRSGYDQGALAEFSDSAEVGTRSVTQSN